MTTLYHDEALQVLIDDGLVLINMVDRGVTIQCLDVDIFHDLVDKLNRARNALDALET